MTWPPRGPAVGALVVGLVAALIATVVIVGELAAQRDDCCAGKPTVAAMYSKRNTGIDRLLVTGDGQVFAALAQDPLLSRSVVFGSNAELSYRAQRPAWGEAAWVLSLGRPELTGWALVLLAILGCAAAVAIGARLLLQRGANPFWALVLVVMGLEAVNELTPELAAFALFGYGLLLLGRDRRLAAAAVFCVAVATRETMLVGVVGLAAWELWSRRGERDSLRRIAPLALPIATYAAWALVLRLRTGAFPSAAGGSRIGPPGMGLLDAIRSQPNPELIVAGFMLAVILCVASWALAPDDVLTWIATAYLLFSTTMAPIVWGTNAGFARVLLPLYGFGLIAVVGGLATRRAAPTHEAPTAPSEPRLVRESA